VWEKLVARSETALDINVFMAVPTIYSKLIENIEEDRSNTFSDVGHKHL
jgi:acyl-CoA synthetase (AMP-forming)/AMP-acid ligase II